MPPVSVDLLRVVADRTYALGLSMDNWAALLASREFLGLGVTSPELAQVVASIHATINGGGTAFQVLAPQNPSAQVPESDLKVIRQPRIRTQGFGVVTGLGDYVQHKNVTNQLY